jgi:hypothetical protein
VSKIFLVILSFFLGILSAASDSNAHLFPIQRGGKWGFIDRTGRVVVAPKYDQALEFSDGMAAVRVGKKWGYIDASGELRIPPRFEGMIGLPFCGAGAIVYDSSGSLTFVDRAGKLIQTRNWEKMLNCVNGIVPVREKRKWGYLSTNGALLVEPTFEDTGLFGDELGSAKMNGKWGFVDRSGRWAIQPQFDEAGMFSEGLAPVKLQGQWGYVDREGKIQIKPAFSLAHPFSGGRGRVLAWGGDKLSRTGFVDGTGKLVIPPKYPVASDFVNGRAMVRIGNRFGFIDGNGRLVIPASYEWADQFSGGLALVKNFPKPNQPVEYYLDPEGKVVWRSE